MPFTVADELRRRMTRPQRHRLLHGYLLAAALPSADHLDEHRELTFDPKRGRELIVGVLPHPFCNPAVSGCGFCTFPHEQGNAAKTSPIVQRVAKEIEAKAFRQQRLQVLMDVPVKAIYFGGGTANLCEPDPFADLCTILDMMDAGSAEVTLEGVPAYFLRGKPRLMEVLQKNLSARHYRISMGIQTFDETRLKQMGRSAFGTSATFREVVEYAHSLGFTASADLLFNLPGQTRDEMLDDVDRAVDLGLDHLLLYHLVMFPGLGTPWSRDNDLLAELPDNPRAADNWLALREHLLSCGWVQTSLTNFEPRAANASDQWYVYEECSFQPDRYEAIGFGPSATSYVSKKDFRAAVKTLNPTTAEAYTKAVDAGGRVWDKAFVYAPQDQRLFWLIRRLAAMAIDTREYLSLFGTQLVHDFGEALLACHEAGLVGEEDHVIRPSPLGMFYSDSIAAVLARTVVRDTVGRRSMPQELVHDAREFDASHSPMG